MVIRSNEVASSSSVPPPSKSDPMPTWSAPTSCTAWSTWSRRRVNDGAVLSTNQGTNVMPIDPPFFGQRPDLFVAQVSWMVAHRLAIAVGSNHRFLRNLHHIPESRFADVRNIHQHSQAVHCFHKPHAETRQSAPAARFGISVRGQAADVVRQADRTPRPPCAACAAR